MTVIELLRQAREHDEQARTFRRKAGRELARMHKREWSGIAERVGLSADAIALLVNMAGEPDGPVIPRRTPGERWA